MATAPREDTAQTIAALGGRIRELRMLRGLTLQQLSERTGLSPSMISLAERGQTSPSIGTLVALSFALNVSIQELFANDESDEEVVSRVEEQRVLALEPRVSRRIAKSDRTNRVEISVNEYQAGGAVEKQPATHAGREYGLVIEGELTVEVSGTTYELKPGDAISYASSEPHRLYNTGRKKAVAVWVNIDFGGFIA